MSYKIVHKEIPLKKYKRAARKRTSLKNILIYSLTRCTTYRKCGLDNVTKVMKV